MSRPARSTAFIFALFALFGLSAGASAQQASGLAPSGPQVRVVRSVVGAKGENRNGSYVMTDARSNFYPPDDREVIVYFEWEGTKGKHHCEGSVRGPSGEFVVMSSFDYEAPGSRFAGFWKIPMSDSTAGGAWVFDAKVDGEAAGQITFQVVRGPKPGNPPTSTALPTPAEIYKKALASTVEIDAVDSSGRVFHRGLAFLWQPGKLLTSFRSIDGAKTLRLHFPNGNDVPVESISSWSRKQDWAIIPTSAILGMIEQSTGSGASVGDSCYWILVKDDFSRILSQGQVVGYQSHGAWGERIDLSGSYSDYDSGGPLLNEKGEVIGFLGGILPDSFLGAAAPMSHMANVGEQYAQISITAVPISIVHPAQSAQAVSLQTLWDQQQMMAPMGGETPVMFGILGKGLNKPKSASLDREARSEFQRSDGSANLTVHFKNSESLKTTTQICLYDVENRQIVRTNPQKLGITRGQLAEHSWQFPINTLEPGIYRVDLIVGDAVGWREYFKITN